jgi:hypothetical protein
MSRHLMLRFRHGGQLVVRAHRQDPDATTITWSDPAGTTHYFRFANDVDDKTGLDVYEEEPPVAETPLPR